MFFLKNSGFGLAKIVFVVYNNNIRMLEIWGVVKTTPKILLEKKEKNMSKISEEVGKVVTPIVEKLGCYVVEIEFAKKANGDNLTVFVDKKGGVTIDDCEAIHNAIDEPLDELDPTNGKSYTLNVSSPGLDRPIVTDVEYERVLGEVLEVRLFKALDKKKVFVGKLLSLISKATKYIDF